jgi:hypothetical protein
MKIRELLEAASAGATSTASGSSIAATGSGANVGTFFGGSYQQPDNPFRKASKKHKARKESIARR